MRLRPGGRPWKTREWEGLHLAKVHSGTWCQSRQPCSLARAGCGLSSAQGHTGGSRVRGPALRGSLRASGHNTDNQSAWSGVGRGQPPRAHPRGCPSSTPSSPGRARAQQLAPVPGWASFPTAPSPRARGAQRAPGRHGPCSQDGTQEGAELALVAGRGRACVCVTVTVPPVLMWGLQVNVSEEASSQLRRCT